MNWIGGARARVQQQNGEPFAPIRRRRPGQPPQQQQRPSGPDISISSPTTAGERPVQVPRRAYQSYDVSSDPRYELVPKKSDDGVRYRTVPLLEDLKRVFPNGHVLALQLTHQIGIDKIKERRPEDRVGSRSMSRSVSTASEMEGGRGGRRVPTSTSTPYPHQRQHEFVQQQRPVSDQRENGQYEDEDDNESKISEYRCTFSTQTPTSGGGSLFSPNYVSDTETDMQVQREELDRSEEEIEEEEQGTRGHSRKNVEVEVRSRSASLSIVSSQKRARKSSGRIPVDTAISADDYFKQQPSGSVDGSQESDKDDQRQSQTTGSTVIQRSTTDGSFVTVTPLKDSEFVGSAESVRPNTEPTPISTPVADQGQKDDFPETSLTGVHHSPRTLTPRIRTWDQEGDNHLNTSCTEPRSHQKRNKEMAIKLRNTFSQ